MSKSNTVHISHNLLLIHPFYNDVKLNIASGQIYCIILYLFINIYQEAGMQVNGKIIDWGKTARCLRPAQQMLISSRKQQHHWFKKINKREKKENFVLVGITVSEVLVMAKIITCNGIKRNMLFNASSPMSDQNRISPYNVITISSR